MSQKDKNERRIETDPVVTRRRALAGAAMITAGFAGCGGDDSSEPTETDSPTDEPGGNGSGNGGSEPTGTPTDQPVSIDIDPDPVVHWALDEPEGAGTAADSAGDHDGTLEEGISTGVEGHVGNAYQFGGDSAVIDEDGDQYVNGQSAITFAVWVKADEIPHDRGILNTGLRGKEKDDTTIIRYDEDGFDGGGSSLLKFGVRYGPPAEETETSTELEAVAGSGNNGETASELQTTSWQHVALTWQGGEAPSLYLDGKEVEYSVEPDETPDDSIVKGARHVELGASGREPGAAWQGLMDDFRVYHERLSDDQIAALADV